MADHPEATNTVEVGRITIPGVHTIVFLAPPGEHAAVRSRRWWSRVFVVPEEALRQAARDWGAP